MSRCPAQEKKTDGEDIAEDNTPSAPEPCLQTCVVKSREVVDSRLIAGLAITIYHYSFLFSL